MGVLDKFLNIMKLSDDDEYDEDDFFDDDEYDDEYEEKPKRRVSIKTPKTMIKTSDERRRRRLHSTCEVQICIL